MKFRNVTGLSFVLLLLALSRPAFSLGGFMLISEGGEERDENKLNDHLKKLDARRRDDQIWSDVDERRRLITAHKTAAATPEQLKRELKKSDVLPLPVSIRNVVDYLEKVYRDKPEAANHESQQNMTSVQVSGVIHGGLSKIDSTVNKLPGQVFAGQVKVLNVVPSRQKDFKYLVLCQLDWLTDNYTPPDAQLALDKMAQKYASEKVDITDTARIAKHRQEQLDFTQKVDDIVRETKPIQMVYFYSNNDDIANWNKQNTKFLTGIVKRAAAFVYGPIRHLPDRSVAHMTYIGVEYILNDVPKELITAPVPTTTSQPAKDSSTKLPTYVATSTSLMRSSAGKTYSSKLPPEDSATIDDAIKSLLTECRDPQTAPDRKTTLQSREKDFQAEIKKAQTSEDAGKFFAAESTLLYGQCDYISACTLDADKVKAIKSLSTQRITTMAAIPTR